MTSRSRFIDALPFWISLALIPVAWVSALWGGWTLFLLPVGTSLAFTVLDAAKGLNTQNTDPETPDTALFWYKLITWIWAPVQAITVFGIIAYVTRTGHLSAWELAGLAIGLGWISGAIGIVYAHELMHQKSPTERFLGDILMALALYGHFRTEHLLVHHRYVGTPKDAVTARYNESFHRFFPRVVAGSLRSAWTAEKARLAHKNRPVWHPSNPFWRYCGLQAGFLVLSLILGGWIGVGMFLLTALIAVILLEMVNYIEHYGLTRKHLGDGKYEHTAPHHSWNASHTATNWLLINLQRHSDHHYKPDRRFPLLQNWSEADAPQLPYGYPVMGFLAMIPPLWRKRMNPRVRAWRKKHYPEITDWQPYKLATNPMPR